MEYILYDVDKIKDYVFDSYKPKEVKGASELLKTLDFDIKTKKKEPLLQKLCKEFKEITDEAIIFSKGGSGIIKSTENNGKQICEWLESHFPKEVKGASLTAVHHIAEKPNAIPMDILRFKAREKKSERLISKDLEINTFEKDENSQCKICGKRRTIKTRQIYDEVIPYCKICDSKRHALDNQPKKEIDAETLEDICKLPNLPENKFILTIYGDLNQAGKHLGGINDAEEFKNFSETISSTIEKSRRDIESQLEEKGFKVLAPVIGGDDMLFFVHPASLPLIFENLTCIERKLSEGWGKEMQMNFAFLLSKYTFPINHIFQLSQSLLEKTKERYYEKGGDTSYYGLFKVLEGGHRPSFQDVYTLDQFKTLFKIVTQFQQDSKIRTSALYNLLESISPKHSSAEREMNTLYFFAQHREFKDYREYIPSKFYLKHEGKKIELTAAALEDIITMKELAESSSVPSVSSVAKTRIKEEVQ